MMAMTRKSETNAVEVSARYYNNSDASGALFNFVYNDQSGSVSSNRSVFFPLDRNASHNYTLPFNLNPGNYLVCVYDIEHDGTLSNGVRYPAASDELILTENVHGIKKIFNLCIYNMS